MARIHDITVDHRFIGPAQVYLAGPIGKAGCEHNGPWRSEAREYLEGKGIIVVEPLEAQSYLLYEDDLDDTVAKILTERDRRFSCRSDYLLANFLGCTARSMGTCIELGWANASGTTIITVMEEDNEHRHPIIESVSNYIVTDLRRGCEIISSLAANSLEEM